MLRGVTNIQVESSTSTGLVVTWDPPNLAGLWPGGATPPAPIFIESYSISIINAETGDIAQETSASGTARSYEFNDLGNYCNYLSCTYWACSFVSDTSWEKLNSITRGMQSIVGRAELAIAVQPSPAGCRAEWTSAYCATVRSR